MNKIYQTKDGYGGIFALDLSKVVCFRTYTDCYGSYKEHLELFVAPTKFGEPIKFEFIISSWIEPEEKEASKQYFMGTEILNDLLSFW